MSQHTIKSGRTRRRMRAFVARRLASSLGGASSPAYKETSNAAGHGADQDCHSKLTCKASADETAHVSKRARLQVASGESKLHALSNTFPETHDEDQILGELELYEDEYDEYISDECRGNSIHDTVTLYNHY